MEDKTGRNTLQRLNITTSLFLFIAYFQYSECLNISVSFQGFYSFFKIKTYELVVWSLILHHNYWNFLDSSTSSLLWAGGTEEKKNVLGVLLFKKITEFYRNISKYLLLN